jgi:hypothetical protein
MRSGGRLRMKRKRDFQTGNLAWISLAKMHLDNMLIDAAESSEEFSISHSRCCG